MRSDVVLFGGLEFKRGEVMLCYVGGLRMKIIYWKNK